MVFEKLSSAKLSMKLSKCHFFLQGNPVFRTHFEQKRDLTIPPTTPKQVQAFLGLVGYYRKFIKGFAKIATTNTTYKTTSQV